MKRTLLLLTVCGLLAGSAALAGEGDLGSQQAFPKDAASKTGGAREIALAYRSDGPAPVTMPAPKDPNEGPVAFTGSDVSAMSRGAALPNMGGGAVMTPQQQADQNIRQLIRKLG